LKSLKQEIKSQLLAKTESELQAAEEALRSTQSLVRDGDLKSDGKYDTRGIEAGQLAGAQEKRVEELKLELQLLEELPVRELRADDEAALGALLTIETAGVARRYYLASTAGGTMIRVGDETLLVISVFSPLGDAVLGLRAGEEFECEVGGKDRSYKLLALC